MPKLENTASDQRLRLFKHKIVPNSDISRALDDLRPCNELRSQVKMSYTFFFYLPNVSDPSNAILKHLLISLCHKIAYYLCVARFSACNLQPLMNYLLQSVHDSLDLEESYSLIDISVLSQRTITIL